MEEEDKEQLNRFHEYLLSKGLSQKSLDRYDNHFNQLMKIKERLGTEYALNQEVINALISVYPNTPCRAFVKNYLHFLKNKDIEIPKFTGRKAQKKVTIIPQHHIQQLREYFYTHNIKHGLMFDTTYFGALRREELLNIRLTDFNLDQLAEEDNANVLLLVTGKGNKQRKVVLPKLLLKGILAYVQEHGFTPEKQIFRMSGDAWYEIFTNACIKLGFVKQDEKGKFISLYHPHSVRHSRSSDWWEKGIDIVSIQNRLGHASISTTRLYITPDEEKEEKKWGEEYEKKDEK